MRLIPIFVLNKYLEVILSSNPGYKEKLRILNASFYLEMQQHNPEFYSHLTKDLNADEQNNIMSVLAVAEQTRNDLSTI
jgi:hypothetical protein